MRNTDKTSLAAIENAAQVIQHGASAGAPLLAASSAPGKPLLAGSSAPDGPLLAGCVAPASVQITAPLLASCNTDGGLSIRKGK